MLLLWVPIQRAMFSILGYSQNNSLSIPLTQGKRFSYVVVHIGCSVAAFPKYIVRWISMACFQQNNESSPQDLSGNSFLMVICSAQSSNESIMSFKLSILGHFPLDKWVLQSNIYTYYMYRYIFPHGERNLLCRVIGPLDLSKQFADSHGKCHTVD